MNRNKNGIPVECNSRKGRNRLFVRASHTKIETKTSVKRIERAPEIKYRHYVELFRKEGSHRVTIVMPFIREEVNELVKEGWRIIQRWQAPKYVYEKRVEDAEHLQIN